MNKIGFQNFRRFTNFQPIEYKAITFLVGRNNSGKSTLVKALLLINDFLKSDDITSFSFGSNSLEDANIVTYGRAKNRSSYEDCIKFFYQIDNYSISIEISGDDDKTLSTVHKILIIDISENLEFLFEPKGRHITISKKSKISENSEVTIITNIEFLNSEIERVKTHIDSSDLKKSSKEFIFLVEELSALERKKALLEPSESLNKEEVSYSVTTDYDDYSSFMAIFDNIMLFVKFSYDSEYQDVQN
jgi:predicted ATPase